MISQMYIYVLSGTSTYEKFSATLAATVTAASKEQVWLVEDVSAASRQ